MKKTPSEAGDRLQTQNSNSFLNPPSVLDLSKCPATMSSSPSDATEIIPVNCFGLRSWEKGSNHYQGAEEGGKSFQ